jgi:hypothetical protein
MKPVSDQNQASVRAGFNKRLEHLFFTGMSVAFMMTVLVGFARTYYLRPYFFSNSVPPLLSLHGVVFTLWPVFFVIQTVLVASNRTRVHRRLGIVGALLVVSMVVVGTVTAVVRAKQNAVSLGSTAPLAGLVMPLGDMVVFPILIGTALYFRNKIYAHKRLMLLATVSILAPAIIRLPFAFIQAGIQAGPLVFFGLTDLFIVACVVYDLVERARVHRATLFGGLLIVGSQLVRVMLLSTSIWLKFATWLTGSVKV